MKGSGTERRKYPRSKPDPGTLIVCTPEAAAAGASPNLASRVIDLSAIGVCLVATEPLQEGTALRVEISLPGSRVKHVTRGVVRWATTMEGKGEKAFAAGLEFESVVEALAGRLGDSAVLDAFLTLRVAVAQMRLYPKESPQVLKVVTDTYHSIHSYLENSNTLTLSKTPRGLLVSGRRLGVSGTVAESLEAAMLALLEDAGVKSITFKKGVTLEELLTFLNALTKKFWDVKDGKEINRRLRDERVLQVTVDEVQYVALGEGDIVIEDAAQKFAGGETELARMLSSLDQFIESSSQDAAGHDLRLGIIKKLLEKDPNLIKKVEGGDAGAATAPAGTPGAFGPGTGGDGKQGILGFDTAREAIGDLALLARHVPEQQRHVVRRVGGVLLKAFEGQPALRAVMESALEEAMQAGAAPAAAAEAAKEPPAVQRARRLLQTDDDARVAAVAQEGGVLIDELSALGQGDLIRALLASVGGLLLDRLPRRRMSAARALNGLRRSLERSVPEAALAEFEQSVRTALDLERDGGVYSVLADLTGVLADLRIRRGAVDRARESLELLNRHYQIKDPSFAQRGELAYIALERVASGVGFASVAERIRQGDPEVARVVEALDAAATRFLIREIKAAETPAKRMHFAQFIARAGGGAATVLTDEMGKTASPSDILRLAEILPYAMPKEMAEMALGGLLRHGAVAVRRRAAAMLAEQAYPRAGALLLDAFSAEGDAQTRLVLVESLGRARCRPAVDALSAVVDGRGEGEEIRSAACVALGKIGDARAVPVLARIYSKGEKGFTKIFRLVPPAVRASAARALAFFPGSKEAREALKRAREDHDPSVRAVALQALYAPLQEAFGELALGVQMVTTPLQVTPTNLNVGGSVQEVPLEDLCRKIAATESGGLLLFNASGSGGRLWFDAGLLIAGEFETWRDQDAFREIVARREGLFLFRVGELSPERRILAPVSALLEAAARSRAGRPDSNAGRG